MKKRIFSIVLALVLSLVLAVPALAAEPEPTPAPEYRLASVVETHTGGWQFYYTFTYGQGGYLPTEVICADDPNCPVTAVYDEDSRVTSLQTGDGSDEYVYDEAGNCVRSEHTDSSGGTVSTSTYDEAGNCIREETTRTNSDGTVSTSVTEYTYDEAGNCVWGEDTETGSDGTVSTFVYEYTYDEAGNLIRGEDIETYSDGTVSTFVTEYTYDGEGRVLSDVWTPGDGSSSETTTHTYSEDGRSCRYTYDGGESLDYYMPLLSLFWSNEAIGSDGTESQIFYLSLTDSEGHEVFGSLNSCSAEPMLTFDDNGYLVRVDDAGVTIELVYEPVA